MIEAKNFIEEIINNDLSSGKVTKVCTRFPPEPNGYLHIGHAKSLCINFGIKEKYNGKCNLRFDDTNPSKESEEYVNSIKKDIEWLGFNWDELLYASDYFDVMYECAVKLINKGLAYVCELSAEEISSSRGSLIHAGSLSPYRNRSIKDNLDLFVRMRNGEFDSGKLVLRAKIDMTSPNINMRDPVIYRIMRVSHHNTGNKWNIYPMYDFAHPIEDAIEGITHSICTLEFEDHRPLYDWVINNCDFETKPQQIEFARLNVTNTVMSKRFLKSLVDEGKLNWDDPRMPTICGMRRRGYPAEAIKDFCNRIGVAKANSEVEQSYLEACIREYLNINADRAMAVFNPLKVTLTNFTGSQTLSVEANPNKESKLNTITFSNSIYIDGSDFIAVAPPKYHRLSLNGYVRLKGAYIIKCDEVIYDDKGNVMELLCSVVANSSSGNDTSGIKVKGVIQWVDANNYLSCEVRKYSPMLNDDTTLPLAERFNKDSLQVTQAFIDTSVKNAKHLTTYQFMRVGYFSVDYDSNKDKMVFNEVVSLKDSFNK